MGFPGGLTFRIVESPAELEEIYRLRYNVWVEEFAHASRRHFPFGTVHDEFDPMAIHAAAFRKDALVAAARLVLHSERGFPFHHLSGHTPPGRAEETGEISHIVIEKSYRSRKGDGLFGVESYLKVSEGGILPDHGQPNAEHIGRRIPVIPLGILRVLYQMSKRYGLARWLLMTDRKMHALLARFGFPFRQVADAPPALPGRMPCVLAFNELEARMRRLQPAFFAELMDGLEREYRPRPLRRLFGAR